LPEAVRCLGVDQLPSELLVEEAPDNASLAVDLEPKKTVHQHLRRATEVLAKCGH
jgi:hypothetical protein